MFKPYRVLTKYAGQQFSDVQQSRILTTVKSIQYTNMLSDLDNIIGHTPSPWNLKAAVPSEHP